MSSGPKIPEDNVPDYYKKPRKEILEFIPATCSKLLDVGCSSGAFGNLAKKTFGSEVWGIDPSSSVSESASEVLDHFIHDFFSEDLNLPKHYFDVITFNDSLEHFPNHLPPLAACHSLLKPDGVIVASIPNVRYIENLRHLLFEMDWNYEDMGIRDRTHLRFFTKKSIQRTFEEAGYQVLRIKGINPRYWWWESKRFSPVQFAIGKWIRDMNFLQFVIVATPVKKQKSFKISDFSKG